MEASRKPVGGDLRLPRVLRSRALPAQAALALAVPAGYGALCGLALGASKPGYVVLALLGIPGAFLAGLEHESRGEAGLRGALGGGLFGALVLAVHAATGEHAKAALPHPHLVLVVFTAAIGALLGAAGAGRRARVVAEGPAPPLRLSRLGVADAVSFAGSAVLAGSLFLAWFSTSCDSAGLPRGCNPHSRIHGMHGAFDAFQTYRALAPVLLVAAAAPLVLAYVVARGRETNWRPGETAIIVGVFAAVLILLNGIVFGRPGGDSPSNVDIAIEPGYLAGIAGALLIAAGGVVRERRARK